MAIEHEQVEAGELTKGPRVVGAQAVLVEFDNAHAIVEAAKALAARGYARMNAHTPYPIPALDPHLGIERSKIPRYVLAGGLFGAAFAYGLQYWLNGIDYPLNVGGRPLHSGPAFIPITFETTVLFAGLTGFFALFFLTKLPRLHHPLFEVEGFRRATIDRYFLEIDLADPKFDLETLRADVAPFGALRIVAVPTEVPL